MYLSNETFQRDQDFMPSIARVASGSAPSRVSMRPFVSCSIDPIGFELDGGCVDDRAGPGVFPRAISSKASAGLGALPENGGKLASVPRRVCVLPSPLARGRTPRGGKHRLILRLTAFPVIRELFVNGRGGDSLEAFIDIRHEMWMTEKTLIPKLERLIIEDVTWMQHNHPMLQREEQSPHLSQQFEGILQSPTSPRPVRIPQFCWIDESQRMGSTRVTYAQWGVGGRNS